jgi:uncharacterized protein YjbI with pentapeptide repeats
MLLSGYIGWRALAGDENTHGLGKSPLPLLLQAAPAFAMHDLTDADFTCATLKSTDFRRANLTRTRWHQAKMLDRVRPGTTYLTLFPSTTITHTGQGQAQNFDRQALRGVNLQGANLADASFIGTDLSCSQLARC